jgi:hypothetical protein
MEALLRRQPWIKTVSVRAAQEAPKSETLIHPLPSNGQMALNVQAQQA